MTDEKTEIVREIFAASNAHQRRKTAHHFHDDLEYDGRGLQVPDLDRIYRGPEEVRLFWREWFEAWKHIQTELVWIKARGEHVVAWEHQLLIGEESSVPVELTLGWASEAKADGRVRDALLRPRRHAASAPAWIRQRRAAAIRAMRQRARHGARSV